MAAQLVAGEVAEALAAWCVTWRHLAPPGKYSHLHTSVRSSVDTV